MTIATLFTPTTLGALALKNRIVMAPLTRSRADANGIPATFAAKYYAQRASAGLVVAEMTQVSVEGMGYARTPGIHSTEQVAAWRPITDAVHNSAGTFVLQLGHVGRIASKLNRGQPADVVSASAIKAPGQMWTDQKQMVDHDTPRALETAEIARIAEDYARAAQNAIAAGFDGVEFHSANGYLQHQFLSSNVNQRSDRYGGSIANRIRMPLEVLAAITSRVGADRVGIRVSPGHTFNGIEETDADALYAAYYAELDKLGLAYLHVMRPFMNAVAVDPVTIARKAFKGPIIAAGGYDGPTAGTLVASGGAQGVAFGKAYVSNPDLAARIRTGAALTEPDQATFYTPGEKGYTDYAPLAA
jgi:N-ethylmaleimide reductase